MKTLLYYSSEHHFGTREEKRSGGGGADYGGEREEGIGRRGDESSPGSLERVRRGQRCPPNASSSAEVKEEGQDRVG